MCSPPIAYNPLTVIETHQLTKKFVKFAAVKDINLTVRRGEVLALLGPNGAGKTTTVRMLTSILKPSSGWARVAGFDVVKQAQEVRASVGVLAENHGLYFRMRAREYLDFFGELYGMKPEIRRRRASELMERFGLAGQNRLLGKYSKGMRQKLALVRTMLHDPPVLLLDEPTSALDPESARLVRDSIAELRGAERAIVLCTHNLAEAESLADRIAIIRKGQIIAMGSPAELKARLLAERTYELHTAAPLNGQASVLSGVVQVTHAGGTWLRYRSAEPARTNPLLLRQLAEAGVEVVTLCEVGRTLEEVYLQVMAEENAE